MSIDATGPWYVARTKSRREALAARKLREQGYEVYLPMLVRWTRKRGVWRRDEEVMFPRYGFVRRGRPGQSIAPIRSTPGVAGLVVFGDRPATLSATIVQALRAIADQDASARGPQPSPFKAGDAVAIADGPFAGLTGIVSRVAEQRVVVLLTLLGRETPVAFPHDQIVGV